jgi:hypothetical protein
MDLNEKIALGLCGIEPYKTMYGLGGADTEGYKGTVVGSTYRTPPYPESIGESISTIYHRPPKVEKPKPSKPEDEKELKEKRIGWWKKAKEAWKNWK